MPEQGFHISDSQENDWERGGELYLGEDLPGKAMLREPTQL